MDYQQKLAALTRAIAPHLRPDLDSETYASGMLEEAADDDQTHFEVRGLHTRSGNPFTFNI
jgi:hypothetical protein